MMNYSDKLRDPRWQKVRLKVFQRDGWKCRRCKAKDVTLAVHHLYYKKGKDPWDYPLKALATLCELCHEEEKNFRGEEERKLLYVLRTVGLFSTDLGKIRLAFIVLPEESKKAIKKLFSKALKKSLDNFYDEKGEKTWLKEE